MYTLYIGNKNYSSWSLRGWLAVKLAGAPFEEVHIRLRGTFNPDNLAFSPTALVPALHDGSTVVWDSLAIGEYLAERHPGMWPQDPVARAWARSIAAEMHSGFVADAQRHDDVHSRAPRRAPVVGRRGRERRAGRGHLDRRRGAASARAAISSAAHSRLPTCSTPRLPSGSRPTPSVRRERRVTISRNAACAIPSCASGRRPRWRRRKSIAADEPRLLYRDKLKAAGRL